MNTATTESNKEEDKAICDLFVPPILQNIKIFKKFY